jgi:3-mercaptopyruvate sulfurtransferase SseA
VYKRQASIPGDSGSAITDFLVPPYPVNHTTGTPTSFDLDMSNYGIKSETGLIWYLSTAQFTKTIAGAVAVAFGLIDKPL